MTRRTGIRMDCMRNTIQRTGAFRGAIDRASLVEVRMGSEMCCLQATSFSKGTSDTFKYRIAALYGRITSHMPKMFVSIRSHHRPNLLRLDDFGHPPA